MALTFPLSLGVFYDLLFIEDAIFTPSRNDELSGLGNGQPLNFELASPLWQVNVTSGPINNQDSESVAALIEVLERPGNDFYVSNPRKPGPRSDPTGANLAGFSPSIAALPANNRQIQFKGLPANYVLSRGDMFSFDYGPEGAKRRALHRLVETVAADGDGDTVNIEVFPHIRSGATLNTVVTFVNPAMRAKIIPGTYRPSSAGSLHQRLSFSAIQKLF